MKKRRHFFASSFVGALALIIFFSLYNFFLLDSSIERIRLALRDVAQADSVFETDSASFFLQDLLITEIGKKEMNFERVVASDAFQSVLASPKGLDRKTDARFLLENLLFSYQHKRFTFLQWVDWANQYVMDRFYDGVRFLQYVFIKSGIRPEAMERAEDVQIKVLHRAREFELKWQFPEAVKAYHFFIDQYPDYPKLSLVKLYLTSVYLRSMQYDLAEELLSQINITLASPSEIRLTAALRKKLKELRDIERKREGLLAEIERYKKEMASEEKPPASDSGRTAVERRLKKHEGPVETRELAPMLFQLGLYHLYLFDLQGAKKAFEEVLGLAPGEDLEKQAKWITGWIFLLQSNFEESRRLMRELLERFPQDRYAVWSSFTLAAIAERTGEYAEAAREYERLAKIADSRPVQFLFQYRAGDVYLYDLQDLANAQKSFLEAKQYAPSSLLSVYESDVFPSLQADARETAFQWLFQGDSKTARRFFEDALKINPDDAWAHCGYGLSLYLDGEEEDGKEHVVLCRNLKKDEYTASSLAYLMNREEKLDEAAKLYEEAIRERPDYVIAVYNLARIEIEQGDLEAALKRLEEARRYAGRFIAFLPLILNNLGLVYWSLDDQAKAEKEFLSALEHDPYFEDAHFNLAQLYEVQGKIELSERHARLASEKTQGTAGGGSV